MPNGKKNIRHIVKKATSGTKSNRLALSTSKFTKGSTGTFSETGTRTKRSVKKANVSEEKSYAKARTKKHRDRKREADKRKRYAKGR